MKRIACCSVMLAVCVGPVGAQLQDPNTPPQRVPKTPPKKAGRSELPPTAATPEAPSAEDETEIVPKLNGLIFVKTPEEIKAEGASAMTGIEVRDIPLLSGADFKFLMARYLGRPAKGGTIKQLEREIILYCRTKNRPVVDVILPEQGVDNGVLQLVFLEGRVGKVVVDNEGKRWVKDERILKQVRLHPGDVIDSKKLLDDLDWLNRDPFREVNVRFKQGDELGRTDVDLPVIDRFPIRVYAGFDNTGNRVTGVDRLLAGVNAGNLFGQDHQFNYQYTTDTDFEFLKANSASYVAPLPWRHTITLLGSYVDAKAANQPPMQSQSGRSYQASMRYSMPLPTLGKFQHEATVGYDFKRSNNSLEFNSVAFSQSDTDVDQFEFGYTGVMPDPYGQTSFSLEAYYSPGGLTAHNNDTDFNSLSPGAVANYVYGRLNAERITRLPEDFSWIVRGQGQVSNNPLLPSEQIGLGGYATVRGYEERVVSGNDGWYLDNEIRTPGFRLGNLLGIKNGQDYLQFLAFFDYGSIRGDSPHVNLYSTGAGLRYTVSKNVSFRLDVGVPLKDINLPGVDAQHTRAHFGLVASY